MALRRWCLKDELTSAAFVTSRYRADQAGSDGGRGKRGIMEVVIYNSLYCAGIRLYTVLSIK